jgi:CHAD domain-containing protein
LSQSKKLQANLRRALASGDPEGVHQVRVTSRRLQEPLEACRKRVKGKTIDSLIKRLKGFRRAFARVRELDVLLSSLEQGPIAGLDPAGTAALRRELEAERDGRLAKAQKKCSRLDKEELEHRIRSVFAEFGSKTEVAAGRVSELLDQLVSRRAEQVLSEVERDTAGSDLHQIRLALKRLRYAVELQVAVQREKDARALEPSRQAQALLGDWNDQLHAASCLSGLARQRSMMAREPELAAALFGHAEARMRHAQKLADEFRAGWPEFQEMVRELAGRPSTQPDRRP